MKEFVYKFYRYGYFLEDASSTAPFGEEKQLCLVIEPQEYELKLSGEVLRKASCPGYRIQITDCGAVRFCDYQNNLLAELEGTERQYPEFGFEWTSDALKVSFGHVETEDRYPDCDGESDRWRKVRIIERKAVLLTATNTATVE